MKVRIFGGGSEALGATPFQIEWITVKASAQHNDSIDPDNDTLTHHEYRDDKDAAIHRAQEVFNSTDNLCWSVVTVRKQIVDWFSEEDDCFSDEQRVAGWKDTDEETDILAEDAYAQYMAAKAPNSS